MSFTETFYEDNTVSATTSTDTTNTVTPAVGDLCWVCVRSTAADVSISSTGATWTRLGSNLKVSGQSASVFRCTGAGSLDNITISTSSDSWEQYFCLYFTSSNAYVGVLDSGTGTWVDSITLAWAGTQAAMIALGSSIPSQQFGTAHPQSGWTTLRMTGNPSDLACLAEYRESDASSWTMNPDGASTVFSGIVLEFGATYDIAADSGTYAWQGFGATLATGDAGNKAIRDFTLTVG